jgi:hypothetical protein
MSFLRAIEQSVERVVERGFRRAFRSDLQPVELARKLAREMEDHKIISVSKVYAPNEFHVYLSPADRESFATYEDALRAELATYLAAHARSNGLALVAPPTVALEEDTDLRLGEFGIACRMIEAPRDGAAAPADEPRPAPANDVPAPPPAPEQPYRALAGVSGTQVISPEEARAEGLSGGGMTLAGPGGRHQVAKRVTTLGRSRDCDVVVPDPNVSRVHAEIRQIGPDHILVDMGSTNGTEVNGHEVKRHVLADGDVIVLGTTEVRVELA